MSSSGRHEGGQRSLWWWLGWLWVLLAAVVTAEMLREAGDRREHLVSGAAIFGLFAGLVVLVFVASLAALGQAVMSGRKGSPWATWSLRSMGSAVGLLVALNAVESAVNASDGWALFSPCAHVLVSLPLSRAPVGWLFLAGFVLGVIGISRDQEPGPARACVSFLVILGLGSAMAVPGFVGARARANSRACYANQKTISGAAEMYGLDHKAVPVVLNAAFYQKLRSGGYLQAIPTDPGSGDRSTIHYRATTSQTGIECLLHGSIQ